MGSEPPCWQKAYEARKARRTEAQQAWRDRHSELIEALGGDKEARRVTEALLKAGVASLSLLREACAGTMNADLVPDSSPWYADDDINMIPGIGPSAVSRIHQAVESRCRSHSGR